MPSKIPTTMTNSNHTHALRLHASGAASGARRQTDIPVSAVSELLLGTWPLSAVATFLWAFVIPLEFLRFF